jgi:hypothetical protein
LALFERSCLLPEQLIGLDGSCLHLSTQLGSLPTRMRTTLGWIVRGVIDSMLRVNQSLMIGAEATEHLSNLRAIWIHDFLREAVDALNDEQDREIVIKHCLHCASQSFDTAASSLYTEPLDLIITDLSTELDAYSVITLPQLHARIRDEIGAFNRENATQLRVRAVDHEGISKGA